MPRSQPETLLIGQSGGATAVINASLAGIISQAKESNSWNRILGLPRGIEGLFKHKFFDLTDIEDDHLHRIARTPSAALGTGRYKLKDDDLARAVLTMQTLGVTAFVYIGGNDSADTAHRIGQFARNINYALNVISVPKTIDNDLPDTDFSPGYPSLAKYLGNAVRDATYDTIATSQINPVKFVEVMGRNAGWVAASATAGFSADERDLLPLLLLPERAPESADHVLEAVEKDVDRRGFSVVVVPETMRTSGGTHFGGDEPEFTDSFGHPYYASTGAAMTRLVREKLGMRARYDKPGTSARMSISMASEVDFEMAWKLGAAAITAIDDGVSGKMTALKRVGSSPASFDIDLVPQTNIANRVRQLDDVFIGNDGMSVTSKFQDYLQPLLGENPFPAYGRLDEARHIEGSDIPSLSRANETAMADDPQTGDLLEGDPEVGLEVSDGADGIGIDAEGREFEINIGQDVICSDGNKLGEVVDVLDNHLVVEKGFFNPEDMYIPKEEISSFDEYHLRLRVSRDEANRADWDEYPESASGGSSSRGSSSR